MLKKKTLRQLFLFNKNKLLALEKKFYSKFIFFVTKKNFFYNMFIFSNKTAFFNGLKFFKASKFFTFFFFSKSKMKFLNNTFYFFSNTLICCTRSVEAVAELEGFLFQACGLLFYYSFWNSCFLNFDQLFLVFEKLFLKRFFFFCQFWLTIKLKLALLLVSLRYYLLN